jgi:hypothetical protein
MAMIRISRRISIAVGGEDAHRTAGSAADVSVAAIVNASHQWRWHVRARRCGL